MNWKTWSVFETRILKKMVCGVELNCMMFCKFVVYKYFIGVLWKKCMFCLLILIMSLLGSKSIGSLTRLARKNVELSYGSDWIMCNNVWCVLLLFNLCIEVCCLVMCLVYFFVGCVLYIVCGRYFVNIRLSAVWFLSSFGFFFVCICNVVSNVVLLCEIG